MKQLLKRIYQLLPFKKQIFSFIKQIGTPPQAVYKHLHFHGLLKVNLEAGQAFKIMHYGYPVENQIFWEGITGGWEKYSMKVWMDMVQKSQVIFDIGANTGVYTLVAKALNPNAEVHGFEPFPAIYDKYVSNIQLNSYDVHTNKLALSNNNGEAVIYAESKDFAYSVTVNQNLWAKEDAHKIKIETITLDKYIADQNLSRVDLMKIDVETHEPEVLEGFRKNLPLCRPIILIEILNQEVASKLEPFFPPGEWAFFNIDENRGIRSVSRLTKSDYYNFLIVPNEKRYLLDAKDFISHS